MASQPPEGPVTPRSILAATLVAALLSAPSPGEAQAAADCPPILDHEAAKLHSSETVDLCEFAGRPLLLVNTASFCGFTRQFEGLQELHERYEEDGLAVIGFPSHDFDQEADDEAVTEEVCRVNFGVTFTMLSPSPVASGEVNPVFAELARQGAELPRWNFHKYVVDRDGAFVAAFGSHTRPESPELRSALERVLD